MTSKSRMLLGLAAAAILFAAGTPGDAMAQDRNRLFGYHGFGPRVGFQVDDLANQVFFGGHVDFGEAFPKVRFQPNLEIGFGEDFTLIQADADFHYRFLESWDIWNPYLGGGIGIVNWSGDIDIDSDGDGDNDAVVDVDDTDVQLHIVGGIEKYISAGKFFVEAKVGLMDESPDMKFLAGWTFTQ